MNQIVNKSVLAKGLLLIALFPVSFVGAASSDENSLVSNTKIGIDFGFGLPYAWAAEKEANKRFEIDKNDQDLDIKANSNMSLGVVLGYRFFRNDILTLCPETGLSYGFARRFKTPTYNITVEEKYLQIPIAIKFCRSNEEDAYPTKGFTLGYEFNVLLSSVYKQEGNYPQLKPSFIGNKDLKQAIPDLPRLSGNIFLGVAIDLPKGFYLGTKLKVPIEVFKINNYEIDQLNKALMYPLRLLNSSFIEFNLGVNFMKWF